ncbi:MAG TPA: 2-aminoethylphosphonate--pyruvate transaminase [Acetobacteraceae bacterium]|nr:2-aminoethylphosphonate--pyruvate transaminase [Acetobacteraceae bacterium]
MKLLIPGPVTTHAEVRAALAHDFAPWDGDFYPIYAGIRERLLPIAGVSTDTHASLPLQGSGHFIVEAAIRSFVPRGGKILVPMTGGYAARLARLARTCGREVVGLPVDASERTDPRAVASVLAMDPAIGHLAFVYSETSTGVVHDAVALSTAARVAGRRVIIDAVSAFGALPLDLAAMPEVDAVLFTANKCLEAMPGLAFAIAPKARLIGRAEAAESWCLDLADIYEHAEHFGAGSFRFTPPAQVLNALLVALEIFAAEGGAVARLARYRANLRALYDGVQAIGLTPYLPLPLQGPIVMNVLAPDDPRWDLLSFVELLKQRGFLISNFYDTPLPSFRVGLIGALGAEDYRAAVAAMDDALGALGIRKRKAA